MSTIAERVAAGTAWLDETLPGWFREVDLDLLVISSPCNCVLGQVFGNYWRALGQHYRVGARDHGFNAHAGISMEEQDVEYAALDVEWRRVITERRAAA